MRTISLVSSAKRPELDGGVCIFVLHHTVVCEFMTLLIKHNSLTPLARIHPYIKALPPPNVAVGTKHFSHCTTPLATPDNFGCFWIWNDWLSLLRQEYGFPEVSILWLWALEGVKLVYFALVTVGNSSGDHNVTSAGCVILWDKV